MVNPPTDLIFNKIGLHTGPGTNPSLVQEWLTALEQTAVPAFLTIADPNLLRATTSIILNSPLPHTIVYTPPTDSLDPKHFAFHQADFYKENKGQEARLAAEYWDFIHANLPPEFEYEPNRGRFWLELLPGSRLILRQEQADWLGEFAVEIARLADGYRLAFFGWQNDTPDPAAWHTDGMGRMLYHCQQNPQRLGISFHEYSQNLRTILTGSGNGLGRFRDLFTACDEQGIARPTVLITEWGWTQTNIPSPQLALRHIDQANRQLYALYPELLGAGLWTLATHESGIARKVQDLLPALITYAQNTRFTAAELGIANQTLGQSNVAEADTAVSPPPLSSSPTDYAEPTPQMQSILPPMRKGGTAVYDFPSQTVTIPTYQQTSYTPPEPLQPEPLRPAQIWWIVSHTADLSPDTIPAAQPGDLLLLYRPAPTNALTNLVYWQPNTPLNQAIYLTLERPIPATLLATHPALAHWWPTQSTDLQTAGIGHILTGIITALNPTTADHLAEWTHQSVADVLTNALPVAAQLADRDGRFQALTTLLPHLPDPGLAATLHQDNDWRIRRAARQASGETPTVHTLLADAQLAWSQEQYPDVLTLLQKPEIAWESVGNPSQQVTAHTLLAQTYEKSGHRRQALHHWQQAAQINPTYAPAFEGMERNTSDDDLEKSAKIIAKLQKQTPDAAGPAAGLAAIAARRNDYDTAVALLSAAIQRATTDLERQHLEARRDTLRQFTLPTGNAASPAPDLSQTLDPREKKLYEALIRYFSKAEITALCADLSINAELLNQDRLNQMAYDLVRGLANQDRLTELETLIKQQRPTIAHLFQDSVPDLIRNAQALLAHQPNRAIRYLQDQKSEWETASPPEQGAIYTLLAQAHEATPRPRLAYLYWQKKGLLLPDAADAFQGMARTAPDDALDSVLTWMRDMQAQFPAASGPAIGLAAIAQRRQQFDQAADLLANAPAASLVRQKEMAATAAEVRQAVAHTAIPTPPTPVTSLTSNTLNLTLADLSRPHTLSPQEQLDVLRDWIEQTLALPTLSLVQKQDLKARTAEVLAAATARGRVTPPMLADLHLPALDALFITDFARRRALLQIVADYQATPERPLALFLRRLARQQLCQMLAADTLQALRTAVPADQAQAFTDMETAVCQPGHITFRQSPPADLSHTLTHHPAPIAAWRAAHNQGEVGISGNLVQHIPAPQLDRWRGQPRDFWLMAYDLLHNQAAPWAHLAPRARLRRSPLPDALAGLLLYAFHPDEFVPFDRETAVAALQALSLGDKTRQLDYTAYLDLAHTLYQDEDLSFTTLDDVAYFLQQMGHEIYGRITQTQLPADADTAPSAATLKPALAPRVRLRPAQFDTDLTLPPEALSQLTAALNAGNHLILIGPPGTGKTTTAQDICRLAQNSRACRGYLSVTATADWTTFDTVGGYMPAADGRLTFHEGSILRAIREEKWLIIDEINRADIDKAFGELFTVLSGQPVTLPYRDGPDPIRILPPGQSRHTTRDYLIPTTWRIVGTMNVYDKASLFEMSYAFMRRFAFIDIPIPDATLFPGLINRFLRQAGLPADPADEVARLCRDEIFRLDGEIMRHRPLGPAIARDLIRYVGERGREDGAATPAHVGEAFLLYALPQFDGLEEGKITAVSTHLQTLFPDTTPTGQSLRRRLHDLFPQYNLP